MAIRHSIDTTVKMLMVVPVTKTHKNEDELNPAPRSSLFLTSNLIPSALLTHRMALAHSTMFSTRAGRRRAKGMEARATTFRLV